MLEPNVEKNNQKNKRQHIVKQEQNITPIIEMFRLGEKILI